MELDRTKYIEVRVVKKDIETLSLNEGDRLGIIESKVVNAPHLVKHANAKKAVHLQMDIFPPAGVKSSQKDYINVEFTTTKLAEIWNNSIKVK